MDTPSNAVEIQFQLHTTGRPHAGTTPSDSPPSGSGRLPRVTQVMAMAIHFQDMIQRGEAQHYADIGKLGCLSRERVSQVMELLWLAPRIQQEILEFPPAAAGRFPITEVAVRRIANAMLWEDQGREWKKLQVLHHLG
jgi:hypothetical protein